MVHVDIKDLYKIKYTLLWSLLSFKSGLLNASGFLIAGSYVSHVTGFGTQGGENSIFLIALLCLVCGLKNGLTTWASHGKIRTTHITGLSTDIGLHLQKIFRAEGSNSPYPESRKVTYVRIATLVSFSIGSCILAVLIPIIGFKIFYISFLISAALSIISVMHRSKILSKTN